jgi:hypothetical protein
LTKADSGGQKAPDLANLEIITQRDGLVLLTGTTFVSLIKAAPERMLKYPAIFSKKMNKKCVKICMFIQVFTLGKCTFAILSAKPGKPGFL